MENDKQKSIRNQKNKIHIKKKNQNPIKLTSRLKLQRKSSGELCRSSPAVILTPLTPLPNFNHTPPTVVNNSRSGDEEQRETPTDSNNACATIFNSSISESSTSPSELLKNNIGVDTQNNSPYGSYFDAFDHQQDFNLQMLVLDKIINGSACSQSSPFSCESLDGNSSNNSAKN